MKTALHIRAMTAEDISLGMRLKGQNGWNQLEGDWRRVLDLESDGCFVAEINGQGVGTACTCVFGPVAWVCMVLVDASCRKQGIGTALMEHVVKYLDRRGILSIRLDATPLGRPVYEKLGFQAEFSLARYTGIFPPVSEKPLGVEPVLPDSLDEIVALDRVITGTDRGKLLRRLFAEHPAEMRLFRQKGEIEGYLAVRFGSNAMQIGPCLGSNLAGKNLLRDAWNRYAGQAVFLDVPLENDGAGSLASKMGLQAQREFLRMGRGPRIREKLDYFWTSSGPEKG